MPAKYSHIKKRSASGLLKKEKNSPNGHHIVKDNHLPRYSSPHVDRSITQAMSAVSQLERAISRILLLRYEQDIARLYSTRLFSVALVHLPTLVMRCCALGGPSWVVFNHDSDEIKDFFRAAITMDLRQAGERVATKSVLWSYTALRHFAVSNDIPICSKLGLHSLRLLPFFPALQAHLESLEAMSPPVFNKPPHLGTLQEGLAALEDACELKFAWVNKFIGNKPEWDGDWRASIRYGYEKLVQTMWRVAREFEVRGYGNILRDKLTSKWCDCGCSTDHLGEVCERTVREEEEQNGVRSGKRKEWDGRGSGVYGWETTEEEDIWEIEMDFGGAPDSEGNEQYPERELTVDETMEWRYLQAEHEKELGNVAFRKGDYQTAVERYQAAYDIEPELPHYQLNLAAAHLKLSNWIEAEQACTKALAQHRSSKGLYRRAKARRMLNRPEEAIQDLRAVLRIQPNNREALTELLDLIPDYDTPRHVPHTIPENDVVETFPTASASSSSSSAKAKPTNEQDLETVLHRLGIPRPKHVKPPPFTRTRADDKKLKITFSSPPSGGNPAFPMLAQRSAAKANGKTPPLAASRAGKEKAGSGRTKKLAEMEQLRKECATYPCWERYAVKQVD